MLRAVNPVLATHGARKLQLQQVLHLNPQQSNPVVLPPC
jgi:hypothetical protein